MITEKVMLDASKRGVKEIIHAVQGENDSRTLEFQVYDTSGKIVNLTNATVYFYVQKNDGTIVMLPASISDNTASVVLTLQTCSVEGDHPCWIQIVIPNESDLRVDDIILRVQACDFDGAVESSSEFTALTEATSAAITATENANNAAAEARSTAASTATATINAQKAQPNGLASLDAAGKLEQMPTYEDIGAVPTTRTVNEKALSSNISLTYSDVGAISTTEKGAANGLATLDADGRLTAAQTAITTGSNANGTWIRFPDGTQICTKIITISMKIETADGSMYYGTRTSLGDFAMPFTEAPAESLLLTTGPSAFLDVARDITATSAGSVNLYKSLKMPTVGDYPIHVIAIGKWK